MKFAVRDLGCMEYAECWQLQQQLFDDLLARKRAGATAINVKERCALFGKPGRIDQQILRMAAFAQRVDRRNVLSH